MSKDGTIINKDLLISISISIIHPAKINCVPVFLLFLCVPVMVTPAMYVVQIVRHAKGNPE